MDTTKIEIIGKQFDKIAESVAQHPNGLTSGQIALIAAAIGASAAILAQLVIFTLNWRKEKSNLKRELIADERRIAYLLTEFYKELVMHKVHKMYWYRTSEIWDQGKEDKKESHDRHFTSNEKSFETMTRIRITTSDYFKNVTHFTNLTGKNKIISQVLNEIKSFKPRKASNFESVTTYNELLNEQEAEENELNIIYLFYSVCYDRINAEMIK